MFWFCHISEFGGEEEHSSFTGATVLPVLLFMSDRLTLWSPSGQQFRNAQMNDESILRPEDLLDLVRTKRIQILGRKEWLMSPLSREKSKWRYAPWDDKFDLPIAEMALEDKDLPTLDQRVVLADEEDGWKWADKQMATFTEKAVTAQKFLTQRKLPVGLLEKADRYAAFASDEDKDKTRSAARSMEIPISEWLRIRSVLRDARNHEMAFKISGSHISVEPSEHVEAIPSIVGPRANQKVDYNLPSNAQLWEFLQIAASLSCPRDARQLEKLLERKDRDDLKREMAPFITNPEAALALHSRLQMDPPNWLSVLNPVSGRTNASRGFKSLGYLGLLLAIVGAQVTPAALIGLGIAILGCGKDLGEKVNWLRVSDDQGLKFPLVLGYDRTSATYKERAAMRKKLKDQFHLHC